MQASDAEARAAEGAPGGPTEEGHGEESKGQQQENSPSSRTILEYKESLIHHTSSTSGTIRQIVTSQVIMFAWCM